MKLDRKQTWNIRHDQKAEGPAKPDPFLAKNISSLKPGSVYDLACGKGRNSIYLAKNGFEIFAVDFSKVALEILNNTAQRQHLKIETMEFDLEEKIEPAKLNRVDNVVVINFKLTNDWLKQIPLLLNNKGTFLYCTFNIYQSYYRDFPSKFCLEPSELVYRDWELRLLEYVSFEDNSGYRDGYILEKVNRID